MIITTIPSTKLHLPSDVEVPEEIRIHGRLYGDYNEVVVIKQLRRKIFGDAYVCHITQGPHGRGIYDMPSFHFIKDGNAVALKRIGDVNYTMVCLAEAVNFKKSEPNGFSRTNWLY